MSQVAIVTGAARGIGRACVERLVTDGYRVVACDIAIDELRQWVDSSPLNEGITAHKLDVADVEAGQQLVSETVKMHGRVDALANVAGYTNRQALFEIDTASWRTMCNVLVRGPVFMTKAVAEHLIAQKKPGSIVHVSSIMSEVAESGQAHYSAAKGALRTVTRAIAQELAPHNIRVNCVGPGLTTTKMTEDIWSNDTLRAQREDLVPLGRYAAPSEIAACIAFLLSDRSTYITGTTLYADGGYLAV